MRKSVKSSGYDVNSNTRHGREERLLSLRKEKRNERINIQRRKVKVGSSDAKPPLELSRDGWRMNLLVEVPQKAVLLRSTDIKILKEGLLYIRKILSVDVTPPIEEVLSEPTIAPALVSFLLRWDSPQIQIDAAWCLTNIACGEPKHVKLLLECQIIEHMVEVLNASRSAVIIDQVLWALCNLSGDETARTYMVNNGTGGNSFILVPLTKLVGLRVEGGGTINTNIIRNKRVSEHSIEAPEKVHQMGDTEFTHPSLMTMRNIAFICGNLIRVKFELEISVYRRIVWILSELIFSPDEEIVLDICASLLMLTQDRPHCAAELLAEHSLLTRMLEIVVTSTPVSLADKSIHTRSMESSCTSGAPSGQKPVANIYSAPTHNAPSSATLYEMALLVLCAILSNSSRLYKMKVLELQLKSESRINLLSNAQQQVVIFHIGEYLRFIAHHANPMNYTLSCIDLCKALCGICDVVRSKLNTMDNASYLSQVYKAQLERVIETIYNIDILWILATIVSRNFTFDVMTEVGCATCCLTDCLLYSERFSANVNTERVLTLLHQFLRSSDPELIYNAMNTTIQLLAFAFKREVALPGAVLNAFRDSIDEVLVHPNPNISQSAAQLEQMLERHLENLDH